VYRHQSVVEGDRPGRLLLVELLLAGPLDPGARQQRLCARAFLSPDRNTPTLSISSVARPLQPSHRSARAMPPRRHGRLDWRET
jgi:hypothetical protein